MSSVTNPALSKLLNRSATAAPSPAAAQAPAVASTPAPQLADIPLAEPELLQIDETVTPVAAPAASTRAVAAAQDNLLADILGVPDENVPSLGALVASVTSATSTTRPKLPIAVLKDGNWDVNQKYTAQAIYEVMPTGNRKYMCIPIAHRLAFVGWEGDGGADNAGKAPLYSFVFPTTRAVPNASPLIREAITAAHVNQFIGREGRVIFDDVGRPTPELQILAWRKDTGFFVYSVLGYSPVVLSLKQLTDAEKTYGNPAYINVDSDVVDRPEHSDPKARKYENYFATATPVEAEGAAFARAATLHQDWQAYKLANLEDTRKLLTEFVTATDVETMSLTAIAAKLNELKPVVERGQQMIADKRKTRK